ncbi:MAG: hypothetical protein O3B01_06535 [Planctomycetota bacterium]|nr:hypothetical protein [Planctomycetota bacterium]MDA1138222.1 hypothetical protein [Planctomycetota bacterium]
MKTTVRQQKLTFLCLLALIASTLAIYWPMLGANYYYDDMFHLGFVAQRDGLGVWLLVPHNDHLMPLMRFIYYVCYQMSGLKALPLMALLMVTHLANVRLVFALTSDFADRWVARWFGTAMFALSTVYDEAMYWPGGSHVTFSLFFTLVMLLSIRRYTKTNRHGWGILAGVATFCSPCFNTVGILSAPLGCLYLVTCLSSIRKPDEPWHHEVKWVTGPILGSFVHLILGFIFASEITGSATNRVDITGGALFTLKGLGILAARQLHLQNPMIGLPIIAGLLALAWHQQRRSRIFFIAVASLASFFIVFVFRTYLGEQTLAGWRYYLYPAFGISLLWAMGADAALQFGPTSLQIWQRRHRASAVCVLMGLSVIGLLSFRASRQTAAYYKGLTKKSSEFYRFAGPVLNDYVTSRINKGQRVLLPDRTVLPVEFPQSLSSISGYLIQSDLYQKIVWTPVFFPFPDDFFEYLKDKGLDAQTWIANFPVYTVLEPDPPLPPPGTRSELAIRICRLDRANSLNVKLERAPTYLAQGPLKVPDTWSLSLEPMGGLITLPTALERVRWLSFQMKSPLQSMGKIRIHLTGGETKEIRFETLGGNQWYRYDFPLRHALGDQIAEIGRMAIRPLDSGGEIFFKDLRLLDDLGNQVVD